jgi:hypothetical protein
MNNMKFNMDNKDLNSIIKKNQDIKNITSQTCSNKFHSKIVNI